MSAGKYTLTDFIARVQRVTNPQAIALYHENRPLFEGRPDVFARVVESIPWERGLALAHAARYRQNLDQQVYMAMLRRLSRHNTDVQRGAVSPPCVSWVSVMRCYSDAYATHGATLPSSTSTLALRALSSSTNNNSSWMAASRLLRLLQRNDQLTRGAVLAAAACFSNDVSWKSAMRLLAHLHREHPLLLPQAVEQLSIDGGLDQQGLLAAPRAADEDVIPKPLQRSALHTIASVTSHVPWRVALSNAMCFSYLTHAAAQLGRTSASSGRSFDPDAFSRAFAKLPWQKGLELLHHVNNNIGESERLFVATPTDALTLSASGKGRGNDRTRQKGEIMILPQDAAAARRRAAFAAVVVRKMPNVGAGRSSLAALGFSHDAVAASSTMSTALLEVAVDARDAAAALELLPSIQARLPRRLASRLVLLMHENKMFTAACEAVLPFLISRRCVIAPGALQAILECIVLQNRKAEEEASSHRGVGSISGRVDWVTAVSLVTQLVAPVSSDHVMPSELVELAPRESPLVSSKAFDVRPEVLGLIVKICVEAQRPEAALRCIGAARAIGAVELKMSAELEAMLYCFVYKRSREARQIVEHATKKMGSREAAPLQSLLQRYLKLKQWK